MQLETISYTKFGLHTYKNTHNLFINYQLEKFERRSNKKKKLYYVYLCIYLHSLYAD